MKKFSIIFYVIFLLSVNIFGQDELPKPTAEEEREAKELAAAFFNRFQETQDIEPLIKEFFVKDFSQRLKLCRTIVYCEGEGKDFWNMRDDIAVLNADMLDYQRMYIVTINDMFLSSRLIRFLNVNTKKEFEEREIKLAIKTLKKELKIYLKNNPRLLKYGFFGTLIKNVSSDDGFYKNFKTLKEMRQVLSDYDKYLDALRKVESKLRGNFQKSNLNINMKFSLKDFRVDSEKIKHEFFNYPIKTKIFEIWCEDSFNTPFKVDLIKEDGKLKIIAVYPPID